MSKEVFICFLFQFIDSIVSTLTFNEFASCDYFTCPVGQVHHNFHLSDQNFLWYRTIGQTLMSGPAGLSNQ